MAAHSAQVATTRPPAARMTSPVIQADSSDARNTASGGGVGPDLARRQFQPQSPGPRFDGPFRGSVQQRSRHRMRADDRAEVDDAPAVGSEFLDPLLHGENRAENVDVVVDVKALFGDLREGGEAEYPGIVDQNIQSSERGIHFFE